MLRNAIFVKNWSPPLVTVRNASNMPLPSITNRYSVNSTDVCEEIHDNSDTSHVIVLLKAEHIYLFKRTT